jgi:hypothetical protein
MKVVELKCFGNQTRFVCRLKLKTGEKQQVGKILCDRKTEGKFSKFVVEFPDSAAQRFPATVRSITSEMAFPSSYFHLNLSQSLNDHNSIAIISWCVVRTPWQLTNRR